MKKIFSSKMTLLLLGAILLVFAVKPERTEAKSDGKYVVDMADILTGSEEEQLENTLKEISERLKFDVVVVTTSNLDGKRPVEYADDYFDYNGYGQGSNKSGCLFLRYINGSSKEVWISTSGDGLDGIYDNYIDHIFNEITDDFRNGNYYSAFTTYGHMIDQTMSRYYEVGQGIVIDYNSGNTDYEDDTEDISLFQAVVGAIITALIAGSAYAGGLKAQLKSVETAKEAKAYESEFTLISEKDRFIRSAVSKVSRESSSSSGTHSSSHTSSSGSSHGGGGRSM